MSPGGPSASSSAPPWVRADDELAVHWPTIEDWHSHFDSTVRWITKTEGSLHDFCFANGLEHFGLQRTRHGLWYREWAPAALEASLVGDFNGWDPAANPCHRDHRGVFEAFLRDTPNGEPALRPGSRYKVALRVRSSGGDEELVIRMPAWARLTCQDGATGEFCAVVPEDILGFGWRHPRRPPPHPPLRVYEAHVGMSSSEATVAGWTHFRRHVLPRVARLGYTALLLIGVQEHGYYASFGYQVTSFFAPSSRFGSPSELQQLVDDAHGLGLLVILELVHSHASANSREGLNDFDGSSTGGYFLDGQSGWHAEWGTRMFDYGRVEVLRFLLAQVCWYAEAYRVDGFRFDAVSAALYRHRSLGGRGKFDDGYGEYFGEGSDVDVGALTYFKLVNHLTHELVRPPLLTLAEEHSGLPGLCAPVCELGLGFDLRQAMGLPPLWERLLSAPPSERIDMAHLVAELCRKRHEERRLAYCECHDQCLVGGKSLAFLLMGADMYEGMSLLAAPTARVERGMALHRMVRLLTCALGGEGYLNFMGNEFGHPEWVDFPRAGNGHSLRMARRRWDLADDPLLRYAQLLAFDGAMHALQLRHGWLHAPAPTGLCGEIVISDDAQALCFRRAHKLFAFNFHPHDTATLEAEADPPLAGAAPAPLECLLESDDARFGGRGRRVEAAACHESSAARRAVARLRVPPLSACVVLC